MTEVTPETDEALVRAAVHGDQRAFARLVRRYLRKAMAVALEYARNREDAEDVVQEAFRRAFQSLGRFDPERRFEPWFFTILRNTARNAAESQRLRSHDALNPDHATLTPGPSEDLRRRELRRQIIGAMDRLPPMQKSCFRLCLVEGLTSGETANALGIAESTVRVHVFKARQTMQRLLSAWRDEVEEA
jgi:RNA polymerase sigma-70 factor (ECF subfamily)